MKRGSKEVKQSVRSSEAVGEFLTDIMDPLFTFARQAAIYQSGNFSHSCTKYKT